MLLTNILSRLIPRNPVRSRKAREVAGWLRQGIERKRSGDLLSAQTLFERILHDDPENSHAHLQLGALLGERGDLDRALPHLIRAASQNADLADAHAALGNVLLLKDDKQGAIASLGKAAELDPDNAVIRSNLGIAHQSRMDSAKALREFQVAHRLQPNLPGLLRNLTISHIDLRQFDEILALLDEWLRANNNDIEALKCKGFVLQKMHLPERALPYYERVRDHSADDPELFRNLGIVLQDLGRSEEAIAAYNQAITLKPEYLMAIWHRSLAYLQNHDFEHGWPDYELRTESLDQPRRPQRFPRWSGDCLEGRRLLVHAEQGLGDEIMFASCLPQVIASSRHCVIECASKLESIFRRSFPLATVYSMSPTGEFPSWLEGQSIDYQVAAGSLPLHLRRSIDEFPKHDGYLVAEPERAARWEGRLRELGTGLKVGISWQGGTFKTRQPLRSLPLMQWAPILKSTSVHFVSLQYTDSRQERAAVETTLGVRIHDWDEIREDYESTAALVSQLDLVISVCTAVIHLGGALGRPVWVMAPFSPEWRYGRTGEGMPWYPSVRVFRQPTFRDWASVVAKVAEELAQLAGRGNTRA